MAWSRGFRDADDLADEVTEALKVARPQHAHPVLAKLWELDDTLAEIGWPRLSPWWRETLEDFYLRGRRQLVARVGRRGGKSSSLCRVAVVEALWGEHDIPPGDVGYVAIVSVDRKEASERLQTIRKILTAIGVPFRPIDGGVALLDRPTAFRVYTASIAGVSGFTAICVVGDEVAKWKDADTGINPAKEVLTSIRPTLATMPNGRMFLSSSPMGRLDAHAAAFDQGPTELQDVAGAPTWIANPTITEADTHKLEPDEDKWRREYAAIPLEGTESSLLSSVLLDRATRAAPLEVPPEDGHTYEAVMDPATRGNGWALVIGCKRKVGDRIKRSIVLAREWRGTRLAPLMPDVVLAEVLALITPYGLNYVTSDQHHGDSLHAIGRRIGLQVVVEAITHATRDKMFEALATGFADADIEIPAHPQLRADLLSILRVLTANGLSFRLSESPDGRHGDYASAAAVLLSKEMRDPPNADPRTDAQREQDEAFERARRRYVTDPKQPYWKRKAW